jgi:glycosyltransferase involved in cell wall biosynthesis
VAVLEAGASGLPVVATRHGGIADVVLHDQTGILVEERDIPATAEAMCRLIENPGLAGKMGQAARRHIAEQFSMDRSIQRLSAILEAAADGRNIFIPLAA